MIDPQLVDSQLAEMVLFGLVLTGPLLADSVPIDLLPTDQALAERVLGSLESMPAGLGSWGTKSRCRKEESQSRARGQEEFEDVCRAQNCVSVGVPTVSCDR